MKLKPRTMKTQGIGGQITKCIKGRGDFDQLVLWQIGDIFEVGWEDSAHHYWHSEYYTSLVEADGVYEDYNANGIPDEYYCEDDDEWEEVAR